MPAWNPTIALDQRADTPIFLQIARAISDDVRRGRLRPGDELPGSRTLASDLEVHRNTVLAAYRELASEGWIRTERAGGTFVSSALPDTKPRRFARVERVERRDDRVGYELRPLEVERDPVPVPKPGTLVLASGAPDLRLVPTEPLARAYRRALRRYGSAVLGYGDSRGHVRLRTALAEMLSALRGLSVSQDSIVVTRGSQQALDLVSRTLLQPGDVVAVEALGYRPAWAALRLSGARLVPVPVDASGMCVEKLRALMSTERVRAIYATPHHQYPTTVGMAPGRRMELLELAREHRAAIIEDDYDYEFHYEGRPILPLASADVAGVVVYVGTLSKILAPGLRLGFVVAPRPLAERIAQVRTVSDRQGDQAVECAVAELLEDAEVQRHARRMRSVYLARRDKLLDALSTLGGMVTAKPPAGGMALWAHAEGIDVDAWLERCLPLGVAFSTAKRFAYDGRPRPFMRLGFASLDEKEIDEAVRRMAKALDGAHA